MAGCLLIYGGSGHTGRMLAERASELGIDVILAGRNEKRVRETADELGLPFSVARADDPAALDRCVRRAGVVLNAAGPFADTAAGLMGACIRTGRHYLDIAGELPVFETAARLDAVAKEAGVMIMPGTGFGIVATDCLAAMAAAQPGEPHYLRMALTVPRAMSRGSVLTILSMAARTVAVRRDGEMIRVPVGRLRRRFDFGDGLSDCVAVNWPDAFTAHHTTGVPNCEIYAEAGRLERAAYQIGSWTAALMRSGSARRVARRTLTTAAPDGDIRQIVVAETEDPWRRRSSLRLTTTGGYAFTRISAIEAARRVMHGTLKPGFQTPSNVFGAGFVLCVEGSKIEQIHLT